MLVNVSMASPELTLLVVGNVMFDGLTQTTQLTLRTSATWPYLIDAGAFGFESFVSSLPADQQPSGVYAQIVEDTSASLSCGSTPKSLCYQQWQVTIILGDSSTCDIEGLYTFHGPLLCRDGAPCTNSPTGSFGFSLLPTDFCTQNAVDASANSVYTLNAYTDAAHQLPAASFGIGHYVYFDLSVVDPAATLKSITFANIAIVPTSGPRDILYSTLPGVIPVKGVDMKVQEVNTVVPPGTPVDLGFSFQLLGPFLPNTLAHLPLTGGSMTVSVEATINILYYGDNKKREVRIAMETTQGAAATQIQIISDDGKPPHFALAPYTRYSLDPL